MKLDRALQRELLKRLADVYPQGINFSNSEQSDPEFVSNAWYLAGHGLIEATKFEPTSGMPSIAYARITETGLDFMEDDGGLGAILGVVTVKLHTDTLRALLEAKIAASELPTEDKETLISRVRQMSVEALQQAASKLLEEGIENLPDAIQWLRQLFGA